jgi:hypothetical protein
MVEVVVPTLVGSRVMAAQLLESARAAAGHSLAGERVVLNCRDLRSGSPSFADEVVRRALVEGGAAELVVMGADEQFYEYLARSAMAHNVSERVLRRSAGSEIGA